MFIYMGKLVAGGGRVGVELIDNKFPTVGLMTSAAWRAFGASWWPYVMLQTAMSVAAALMLGRAIGRTAGSYARYPAVLFAVVYFNFCPGVFGGFQLETIQLFFATIAACAALDAIESADWRDAFLVGLAGGTAALVKPSGLAVVAAFAVTTFLVRLREPRAIARHATATLGGLLIPAAAALAYLHAADLFGVLPGISRQISRYAGESSWELADLLKPVVVLVIGGFPLVVRGLIFRRRKDRVPSPTSGLWIFAAVWLLIELAGVVAQRRMYAYHFLVVTPPLAVLFGLLPRTDRLPPLVGALVPGMMLSMMSAWTTVEVGRQPGRLEASGYLIAHTEPGDSVWKDEVMRLLIETDLRPGSRYPMTFLWVNYDEAPIEYCSSMLADFERNRPKYVLLPTEVERFITFQSSHIKELGNDPVRKANFTKAWGMLREYVDAHYVAEAVIGRDTVYRREELAQ